MESREENIRKASVGDQPTAKDTLGFEPYVTAIAEFLTNSATKPPLTLSIEGEWGSGKSSFMKQLKKAIEEISQKELEKELEQELNEIRSRGLIAFFQKLLLKFKQLKLKKFKPKPKIVWFNAWRHDKAEALWATFALEFIGQISRIREFRDIFPIFTGNIKLIRLRFDWKNGLSDVLQNITISVVSLSVIGMLVVIAYYQWPHLYQQYSSTIDYFLHIISPTEENIEFLKYLFGVGGIINLGISLITILLKLKDYVFGKAEDDLKKYLKSPDYNSQVPFIEKFHKDFKKIVEAYTGKNKVYVFIDDLDRCEVPKSADLMQAINLMISDDPQLIFILGMDREKIAAGIAFKYNKLIPYLYANNKTNENLALQGMEYAYSFMEKFIQLPFLVPQPDKNNLETFLNEIFSVKETYRNRGFPINIPIFGPLFAHSPNIYNFYNHAEDNTQSKTVETNEEKTQSRIEKIKIKEGTESQTIRDIIIMVAPALDDNPRRLKQFINLFRLKTFIAASTGLLDELLYIDNNTQQSGLTLEQLGKFTAIALKWPRLLVDLNVDRQLLKKLHNAALPTNSENESENDIKYDYITSYWSGYQKLIELICYGCQSSSSEERDEKYSLENVNVDQLLQVSPRFIFRGVDLPSEKGVDYTRLNQLLARKQWKEADDETYRLMLQVVGRSDGDWIRPEELVNFPCTDLLTIDNLWVKYSDGRFGFTVQKQIYLELGGKPDDRHIWEEFCEKVEWKMVETWVIYNDTSPPQGHLPLRHASNGTWVRPSFPVFSALASRLVNCNI